MHIQPDSLTYTDNFHPSIVRESCAFHALDILAQLFRSKSESLVGIHCVILQWNNYDTLFQIIKLFIIIRL
jgi:hypothetical protein